MDDTQQQDLSYIQLARLMLNFKIALSGSKLEESARDTLGERVTQIVMNSDTEKTAKSADLMAIYRDLPQTENALKNRVLGLARGVLENEIEGFDAGKFARVTEVVTEFSALCGFNYAKTSTPQMKNAADFFDYAFELADRAQIPDKIRVALAAYQFATGIIDTGELDKSLRTIRWHTSFRRPNETSREVSNDTVIDAIKSAQQEIAGVEHQGVPLNLLAGAFVLGVCGERFTARQ